MNCLGVGAGSSWRVDSLNRSLVRSALEVDGTSEKKKDYNLLGVAAGCVGNVVFKSSWFHHHLLICLSMVYKPKKIERLAGAFADHRL